MTEPKSDNIRCLNCGSAHHEDYASATDVEYFTSAKTYQYYRCRNCEVLFIHPVPEHELSLIYPSNYYSFGNIPKQNLAFRIKSWLEKRFFLKVLRRIPGSSLKLLDVGGGSGWLSDNLKKAEPRISESCIVDIDSNARDRALANGHHFFNGRFEEYESAEKFDLILMLNFIEHVTNPGLVMAKAASLLSERGLIVIKTPNYDSLDARIYRDKNWGGYHCPRHWVIFNMPAAIRLFEEKGLHSVKAEFTQGAPFWTVSLLHQWQRRGWIKANANRPLVYHSLFGVISVLFAAFDFLRKPFARLSQLFFVLQKAK